MSLERSMWLFGALFVLFGLALAVIEDSSWQKVCGGISVFCLGCFALAMAGDGVVKGKIKMQFSIIERTAQPRLFWATIGLIFAAGAAVIIAAFWVVFLKN